MQAEAPGEVRRINLAKKKTKKRQPPLPCDDNLEKLILRIPSRYSDEDYATSRLAEGIEYCITRGLKEWSEWEAVFLGHLPHGDPALYEVGTRYAKEVLNRPWPEYECLLLNGYVDDLNEYMSAVGHSETLKAALLLRRNPSELTLYARCTQGRWIEAEDIILESAATDATAWLQESHLQWELEDPFTACVTDYAQQAWKGCWPALELKLERGECLPLVACDHALKVRKQPYPKVDTIVSERWDEVSQDTRYWAIEIAKEYALQASTPARPVLEAYLLTHCSPVELGLYAKKMRAGNWPDAEAKVLARDRPHSIFEYAEAAGMQRWQAAEPLLKGSPEYLLQYADEVLKGRLPDHLHNEMVLEVWPAHQTHYRDEYTKKYGV